MGAPRGVFEPLRIRSIPFILFLVFAGWVHTGLGAAACAAPAQTGIAAAPPRSATWVETHLFFGLGSTGHPEQRVSETAWRSFLSRQVTPRFPAGLTVVDAYGQWRGAKDSATQHERSKLLIIVYPDTTENRAKIDAIRAAWKKMTGDQSVLKVTEPADVSF